MKPWEAGSRCISHFYDHIPEVKARLLAPSFLQAMQGVPIIRSMFRPHLLPRNPRYQRCFEVATERQWLGVQCWRSAGSPGCSVLAFCRVSRWHSTVRGKCCGGSSCSMFFREGLCRGPAPLAHLQLSASANQLSQEGDQDTRELSRG